MKNHHLLLLLLTTLPIQNTIFFNPGQLSGCSVTTFRNSKPFYLITINFSQFCTSFKKCLKKKKKNKCIKNFIFQMENYCEKLTPLKKIYCRRIVTKNKEIILTTKNFKDSSNNNTSSSSSSSSSFYKSGYRSNKASYSKQCKKEVFYIKLLKDKLKKVSSTICDKDDYSCVSNEIICNEVNSSCIDLDEERCPIGKKCYNENCGVRIYFKDENDCVNTTLTNKDDDCNTDIGIFEFVKQNDKYLIRQNVNDLCLKSNGVEQISFVDCNVDDFSQLFDVKDVALESYVTVQDSNGLFFNWDNVVFNFLAGGSVQQEIYLLTSCVKFN